MIIYPTNILYKEDNIFKPYILQQFLIFRLVKKIFNHNKFLESIFFNKKILSSKDETIIVFDALITKNFMTWLKNKMTTKRIILWYWNPVELSIAPSTIPNGIEKWSYSKSDCKKYNLKYNDPFVNKEFLDNQVNLENNSEIYFVGKNKGRAKYIWELEKIFSNYGLVTKLHITKDVWWKLNNKRFKKSITYKEVIENEKRTKAILDIYADNNAGLSLRALESFFLEKKLITNNARIKEYDFYNKTNVFIIGEDNFDDLKTFIDGKFVSIKEEIKLKYTFENWYSNFRS